MMKLPKIAPLVLIVSMLSALSYGQDTQTATESEQAVREAAAMEKKLASEDENFFFFPSWDAPGIGIDLRTVGGFSHGSQFGEEGFNNEFAAELGLSAGIRNLPLLPGTLYASAHFLWARGLRRASLLSLNEENLFFKRYWGGGGVTYLYRYIKNSVSFGLGAIDFDVDSVVDTRLFIFSNDFGVKLIPLISEHLQFEFKRYFSESYNEPSANDYNFWLYTAMQLNFLIDLDFRVGPGFRYVETFVNDQKDKTGTASYLKSFLNIDIFGPIAADGSAYYVFNDDIHLNSAQNISDRLPNQDIQAPVADVFLPRDTLDVSFFAGVRGLFSGLNVGWRYNMRIAHALEREDQTRQFSRNSGYEINYSLQF